MTDLEFVRKCVKGDKPAWDEFIDRYSRLIYNYIHSVVKIKGSHSINQENINDLFQEIFLSLVKDNFKKLRTFKARNGCSLASWLRQVTVNFAIDYMRRFKATVSIDEEDDDGFNLAEMLVSGSRAVPDTLNQEERLAHLKDCIEKLDTEDKYFLELYLNRELPLEELRAHLKVSRGAIDMRKSRLVQRLRDCFKNKALDF